MIKKWKTISTLKLKENTDNALKTREIIRILLANRGIKSKKEIETFLHPTDPYTLKPEDLDIKKTEIGKAIKRIKKAIKQKDQIVVYGDYDADGICATAILWETLHGLGAQVLPFIPQREEHGYGLNKKGIDAILKNPKFKNLKSNFLVITVDNGIVAYEGIDYARKKGIEVIVTDHHQPPQKLPQALALIYSDKIAGAGVAWLFAKEIYQRLKKDTKTLQGFKASNSLELACIGTITDLMPMLDASRSLVKFGLKELQKTQRPGIKALCQQTIIEQNQIDTYHIGYILGPRLNAMGRLEEALESLRLLCTQKGEYARSLAFKLNSINRQRQELTQQNFEDAKSKVKKLSKDKLIFIYDKNYNLGVIGLVAGKLVEKFYRPAIVLAKGKDFSKSSVRSVKGFNIIKFLRQFEADFEDLGGHPMAAGFTVKTSKLKALEKKLLKASQKQIKAELLQPILQADLEIGLGDISWSLYHKIEDFSPFGLGNRRPVFISRQVKVNRIRAVGRENRHLKLKIERFDAIGFNLGDKAGKIKPGDLVDICYTLEKNDWNGNSSLELKLKDISLIIG